MEAGQRARVGVSLRGSRLVRLGLLACVALTALAGCSRQRLLRESAPPQARAAAHAFIAHLRTKQFDWIARRANRRIQGPKMDTTLAHMAALIPPGKANSVKLVGAQTDIENGITERNLTYEFDVHGQWVLINVATRRHGRSLTLTGMHVYRMPRSLESLNRFTLSGKSPLRYATLALMMLAFALTVNALILCARTRPLRRKWLWILFILVGVGKFAVNWTSGRWGLQVLAIQLFSVSAFSAPYGPWIFAVSVPLGAIVFLLRHRREGAGSRPSAPLGNDTSAGAPVNPG